MNNFLLYPMIECRRCRHRDALPVDGLTNGLAKLIATRLRLRASQVQGRNETPFGNELFHFDVTDQKPTPINAASSKYLGKWFASGLLDIAIPMTKSFERIFVLRV